MCWGLSCNTRISEVRLHELRCDLHSGRAQRDLLITCGYDTFGYQVVVQVSTLLSLNQCLPHTRSTKMNLGCRPNDGA